eukprot:2835601-Rhodomonas_salina.4
MVMTHSVGTADCVTIHCGRNSQCLRLAGSGIQVRRRRERGRGVGRQSLDAHRAPPGSLPARACIREPRQMLEWRQLRNLWACQQIHAK